MEEKLTSLIGFSVLGNQRNGNPNAENDLGLVGCGKDRNFMNLCQRNERKQRGVGWLGLFSRLLSAP